MMTPVNLLPWELRRSRLIASQLRRWSRVLLVVLGLVAALWIQKQRARQELQSELAGINKRARPLQQLNARNRRQQTELEKLNSRERLLNQLGAPFEPLQLISVLSTRATVGEGGVRILGLKLTTVEIRPERVAVPTVSARSRRKRQPARVAAKKTEDVIVKSQLTLKGLAKDDLALSEFITSMRHAGVFESVELKSTDEVEHPSGLTREYHIRCVL
jgi:Tfp pilus assembly protein PilN